MTIEEVKDEIRGWADECSGKDETLEKAEEMIGEVMEMLDSQDDALASEIVWECAHS